MKKLMTACFFALIALSACEDTETTTVDITGAGTITGLVSADIDQTDGQSISEPVAGVPVRILWNSEDLAVISDGDSRRQSISVITDSVGVYTAEVPTTENGVSFTIEFDEIDRVISFNDGEGTVTENVTFNSDTLTVEVQTGETVTQNYDYQNNFKDVEVLEKFATITGTVFVDSEQINTGDIPELANGVTVTVEWIDESDNERFVTTTTDANGTYSMQVPTENVNTSVDTVYKVIFEEFATTVDYFDGFRNVTEFAISFEEGKEKVDDLEAGDQEVVNFSYDDNVVGGLPVFGLIEGVVEARVDSVDGDIEPIQGVLMRFTWTDGDGITQGTTTTTNAQGEYTVEVPVTFDDDITVITSRFTVGNYQFNNGTEDVIGTAIYNESTTDVNNLGIGERRTFDRSFSAPDSEIEN